MKTKAIIKKTFPADFSRACLYLLSVLVMTIITIRLAAQSSDDELYRVIPVQVGTVTLTQGKAVVALSNATKEKLQRPDALGYYVTLTPLDECPNLRLSEKKNESFSISTQANDNTANVDYVVLLKVSSKPVPAKLFTKVNATEQK
jgi:hypothetical protein